MSRPEEEYRAFVGSRAASLHRTAYLLCGDWHLADDLVQETFVQTFRHWRRVQRADNQNAYVKRILINEFKRHWPRGRQPRRSAARPVDPPGPAAGHRRPSLPGGDERAGNRRGHALQ
jgi:DNA-directed RNA polymerase specialized sigma24 family protein